LNRTQDVMERISAPQHKPRAIMRRMSEVEARPIQWLWPDRIPVGMLSMIAGRGGVGKSMIEIDIAARVTTGRAWPDRKDARALQGDVVLLANEDHAEHVLKPRILAACADATRIHWVPGAHDANGKLRSITLPRDIDVIEDALSRCVTPRLLVVDPIGDYLEQVNTDKDNDVRSAFRPLATLTRTFNIAAILVAHLNKNAAGAAVNRVMGSAGLVNIARVCWIAAASGDAPESPRYLVHAKSNLPTNQAGLRFTCIGPHGPLEWEPAPVGLTAESLLESVQTDRNDSQAGDVDPWLKEELSAGPVLCRDIQRAAADAGFTRKQLWLAKRRLGVRHKREGFGRGSSVIWWHPAAARSAADPPAGLIDSIDSACADRESMESMRPIRQEFAL